MGRFAQMHIVGVIGDVKQTKVTAATTPEMYSACPVEPGTPLYGIAAAFIQWPFAPRFLPISCAPSSTRRCTRVPRTRHYRRQNHSQAVEESFGSQTLIARLLEPSPVSRC